jgi:hypothetical protein
MNHIDSQRLASEYDDEYDDSLAERSSTCVLFLGLMRDCRENNSFVTLYIFVKSL